MVRCSDEVCQLENYMKLGGLIKKVGQNVIAVYAKLLQILCNEICSK